MINIISIPRKFANFFDIFTDSYIIQIANKSKYRMEEGFFLNIKHI